MEVDLHQQPAGLLRRHTEYSHVAWDVVANNNDSKGA